MRAYLKEFLDHLAFERRLSEHTVAAYRRDLEDFSVWAQSRLETPDFIHLLDHYHLREYLSHCYERLKNVSIARRLCALRSFLRYLQRMQKISANPADLVESPRLPKHLPKPVSVDEAFSICDSQKNDEDGIGIRDQALCELLYASGIRVAELVMLDLDSIDLNEKLIRVMGKGKKERIVPIHNLCAQLLKTWLLMRGSFLKNPNEQALFVGERGERINVRVVRVILSRLGKSLGVNKNLHPHRLRHAYASHMLESGADLKAIQELLGHRRISTTERYTDVDLTTLMKHYDQAHPHARKKNES
jgi:integrase/recombinase XerC